MDCLGRGSWAQAAGFRLGARWRWSNASCWQPRVSASRAVELTCRLMSIGLGAQLGEENPQQRHVSSGYRESGSDESTFRWWDPTYVVKWGWFVDSCQICLLRQLSRSSRP